MRYIIVSPQYEGELKLFGDLFGRSFASKAVADELCVKLCDAYTHNSFFVEEISDFPMDYFEMEEDDEDKLKMAW